MENGKKSRREALGLLGKTGIILGAGSYFFISMKTAPEGETVSELQDNRQRRMNPVQEKALITGSGSRLTVKITGKPGRRFFIGMAASDEKEKYRAFPGTQGIIGADGMKSVDVNLADILHNRIYLKVFAADTDKFDKAVAETEAFVIYTKDGVIDRFEGLVSRPVLDSKGVCVSAEKPAQVVSATKNKYQFN